MIRLGIARKCQAAKIKIMPPPADASHGGGIGLTARSGRVDKLTPVSL